MEIPGQAGNDNQKNYFLASYWSVLCKDKGPGNLPGPFCFRIRKSPQFLAAILTYLSRKKGHANGTSFTKLNTFRSIKHFKSSAIIRFKIINSKLIFAGLILYFKFYSNKMLRRLNTSIFKPTAILALKP